MVWPVGADPPFLHGRDSGSTEGLPPSWAARVTGSTPSRGGPGVKISIRHRWRGDRRNARENLGTTAIYCGFSKI